MDCKERANNSGSSKSGECAEFGNQIIFLSVLLLHHNIPERVHKEFDNHSDQNKNKLE